MSPEQADEFYITLPSNASTDIFENTTASYTTKLSNPIHLTGDWVVGLSSVTIPWSFYNIAQEERIHFQIGGKRKIKNEIKILPGYYESIQSILKIIKPKLQEPYKNVVEDAEEQKKVEVKPKQKEKPKPEDKTLSQWEKKKEGRRKQLEEDDRRLLKLMYEIVKEKEKELAQNDNGSTEPVPDEEEDEDEEEKEDESTQKPFSIYLD